MRHLLVVALSVVSIGAHAQTIVINPRPPVAPVPAKVQRVTIALTITNATQPGTAPGEMTAGFTAANQALFNVIDHECDVLSPLLHGGCRLVQLTTNGNANERQNYGQQNNPVIAVTANATFEIDPTPSTAPGAK